jgi:D-alanyl-D-alanine carboxypeptidase
MSICLALGACRPIMDTRQLPSSPSARAALDSLVRDSKVPGIQYLVVTAETAVFDYAGGWADIAGRRPMTPETTMMAYSMSKTITAAAVLQLVEAQKVGLDDPVTKYVDGLPYGSGITIRELLCHTSGIPNPIPLRWAHPVERHNTFNESAALAAVLSENSRLKSAPDTKYAYSNIGYWLLGRVVERASGEAFTDYVTGHLLRPLGIASHELGYAVADPARHARGYLEKYSWMNLFKGLLVDRELVGGYEDRWLQIRAHYLNGPAFGGLIGSARGFGRFLQDQLRPHSKLFSDTTRARFYETQRTTAGTPVAMTLGWHVSALDNTAFYYKEGGGGGFHCMMRVYPALGIASVVMTNATGFNVRRFLDRTDPRFWTALASPGQ